MNARSLIRGAIDQVRLAAWIRSTRNLALLRRRMHSELDPAYLSGFYRTWVLGHARARLRARNLPPHVPSPLTIKISPTQACNLRCRGCFANNYKAESKLTMPVLERVVEQAAEIGVHTIGVIGGEPLLVPGIFDLLRAHPDTGFFLVTNGTLVDDAVVAELQTLPNVVPITSLEGFEETNDGLRGDGVFGKVMDAMDRMHRGRLIFGFSTTVHRNNRDEVVNPAFVDALIARGVYFGGFLPYVPVGTAPKYDTVCSTAEVAAYYADLDRIAATRPIAILKEGFSDGSFLNQGCRAASTMHVTSDGMIEPCNGIQFATHNVLESTLKEALLSEWFQGLRDLHPSDGRRCLVNTEPARVLEVVERCGATETHRGALKHLREYVEHTGANS